MFNPTEEHQMLRNMIREFVETEVDPQALAFNRYLMFPCVVCVDLSYLYVKTRALTDLLFFHLYLCCCCFCCCCCCCPEMRSSISPCSTK
jgi:hypothetical protein